jgi:hypothetical protein
VVHISYRDAQAYANWGVEDGDFGQCSAAKDGVPGWSVTRSNLDQMNKIVSQPDALWRWRTLTRSTRHTGFMSSSSPFVHVSIPKRPATVFSMRARAASRLMSAKCQ